MIKKGIVILLVLGFAVYAVGCGGPDKAAPAADQYPNKPITLIVPFSAGGTADIMARTMEKVAMKYLGQPLVISNITGGGGTIGWNELAGSKPDGYTIGYVAPGILLQPLYGQTRYHYPSALEPLVQVNSVPISVVVRADQPWQNIGDLVKYAKQHPGELKFGHSGLGAIMHVGGEIFAKEAAIDIVQVPFRGDTEVLAALLGGHVQIMITTPQTIKEQVKGGKVKVLAIAVEQRLADPVFSQVPTFKEQGLNIVFGFWQGIGAPKTLPPTVKAKLAAGLKGILNDAEFKKKMDDLGITVEYLDPQEFADKWRSQGVSLTKNVKETGIADRIASQKK